MNPTQTVILFIAMILCLLFCLSITDAQPDFHDKRTIDFAMNGDLTTQNFYFIGEQPIDLKSMNGTLTGKYFLTRHDGTTISESYSLRVEGVTVNKLRNLVAGGAIVEYEGDLPIKNDPLLHLTGYTEVTLYDKNQEGNQTAKSGLGFWVEGQQLGKKLQCPENLLPQECSEYNRIRIGMRAHLNIKWEKFSILVEYLPHLTFNQYRISASPEFEIRARDRLASARAQGRNRLLFRNIGSYNRAVVRHYQTFGVPLDISLPTRILVSFSRTICLFWV